MGNALKDNMWWATKQNGLVNCSHKQPLQEGARQRSSTVPLNAPTASLEVSSDHPLTALLATRSMSHTAAQNTRTPGRDWTWDNKQVMEGSMRLFMSSAQQERSPYRWLGHAHTMSQHASGILPIERCSVPTQDLQVCPARQPPHLARRHLHPVLPRCGHSCWTPHLLREMHLRQHMAAAPPERTGTGEWRHMEIWQTSEKCKSCTTREETHTRAMAVG